MSGLVITDKDEVEFVGRRKRVDGSYSALYFQWVAGDVSEEDALYCGSIGGDRSKHTVEQINAALRKVPSEHVFFPLPIPWHIARTPVTVADTWEVEPRGGFFLKRPFFPPAADYDPEEEGWSMMAVWFTSEVRMLETLSRHPQHPNIVKYHGCRVRKGRVTGIMLGRCDGDNLWEHLQSGKTVNKEPFLTALASAVDHLHNVVGIVHNDIQPLNIMVSPDGTPTLVDLGAAEVAGADILSDRPHGYPTSRKSRDLAALNKLRTWLDEPVAPRLNRAVH
ncbi:kinase-like domain-containing protein [Lasiosphaeria hispida]|uniref:Kinase-like domain-containing protein n=1 Tax=Lasiosphaeria hispida TaxID=260671 RepID=A0AAJ0M7L5_9PEZI|nr:kinase-like domain-containing protein [Lasiosphaeria hispida]